MTVERKRIFILVKTYPTISATYGELVCTAGILEDGTWIRLYPVPFRLLKMRASTKNIRGLMLMQKEHFRLQNRIIPPGYRQH